MRPSKFSRAAALLAALSSFACAADVVATRVRRPPMPGDAAIDEFVLVCQPGDGDSCRPTRIVVEVCESALEAGCETRRGLHDFLSELDAFDCYVAELRGEEVPSCAPEAGSPER